MHEQAKFAKRMSDRRKRMPILAIVKLIYQSNLEGSALVARVQEARSTAAQRKSLVKRGAFSGDLSTCE